MYGLLIIQTNDKIKGARPALQQPYSKFLPTKCRRGLIKAILIIFAFEKLHLYCLVNM